MIYVGIDDTDMPGTPGTNQFAKALAARVANRYSCELIVRHQLLLAPGIPYTSKNSAASVLLRPHNSPEIAPLIVTLRALVRERFVNGSDPGFCVATTVPDEIVAYGRRCQCELVTQGQARRLAAKHGIHLEGCGGTDDGVVGALAAVGLIAKRDDGRLVRIGDWPDDLSGRQDVAAVRARNVEVRCIETGRSVEAGVIDVGKHLRPNYREGNIVLFARPQSENCRRSSCWRAVRLT